MQEAYLRTIQADQERGVDEPRAFLFRAAKNLSLNELEKRRTRRTETMTECEQDEFTDGISANRPDYRASLDEELQDVLSVVSQLSPRVRDVLILRKVHGLKQREIAKQLGISESTVEKHIAKGMLAIDSQTSGGRCDE